MSTPKAESETLMNAALPLAEQMLQKHGEFFPYGAALKDNGCDSNRGTAHQGPLRVPRFAEDALGLTVDDQPQQVEMVDRHVDQEGLFFDAVPAPALRVASKVD